MDFIPVKMVWYGHIMEFEWLENGHMALPNGMKKETNGINNGFQNGLWIRYNGLWNGLRFIKNGP